uniref:Uncharacterized protein n=1 Tax=Prymnesium polylepis TaxID=72548 RepID=A0A7S4HF57_9EUKA
MGRYPIPPTASPRGSNAQGKRGDLFEPWPWLEGRIAQHYRERPKPQLVPPPQRPLPPPTDTPALSSAFVKQRRIDGPGRYEPLPPQRRVTGDYFPKARHIDGPGRFDDGGWRKPATPRFQTRAEWADYRVNKPASARAGEIIPPPSPRALARLESLGLASPRYS